MTAKINTLAADIHPSAKYLTGENNVRVHFVVMSRLRSAGAYLKWAEGPRLHTISWSRVYAGSATAQCR